MAKVIERNIGRAARKADRPRLWLEGRDLIEHGFTRGTPWSVATMKRGSIRLVTGEGDRKIAGSPERPVIDIVGKALEDAGLTIGDRVQIRFTKGAIFAHRIVGPDIK